MSTFRSVKGTFDLLPDSESVGHLAGTDSWLWLENKIRDALSRRGFSEIRTPILEPHALIARGVGDSTDIVRKEMFVVERGSDRFVMRPELTAPVMRSALQHSLVDGPLRKLYYLGPCFRAERPQKGRYRQFHQFGAEVIGSPHPEADVECIVALMSIYGELGLTDLTLRINSLGGPESRANYKNELARFLEGHRATLGEDSLNRLKTNPLRILDSKNPAEQELLGDAPVLSGFLSEEELGHYEEVKDQLGACEISFVEDERLVRGLDYYSKTAFEVQSDDLGAQNALGGGGRYDGLGDQLGSKKPVPAVGFASGMERLILVLQERALLQTTNRPPDVFLTVADNATDVLKLRNQLERSKIRSAMDLNRRSLKAQMRDANRQRIKHVILASEQTNEWTIRNMETADQRTVSESEVIAYLRTQIAG